MTRERSASEWIWEGSSGTFTGTGTSPSPGRGLYYRFPGPHPQGFWFNKWEEATSVSWFLRSFGASLQGAPSTAGVCRFPSPRRILIAPGGSGEAALEMLPNPSPPQGPEPQADFIGPCRVSRGTADQVSPG